MKILHVCLANLYVENYGYQENIITKMHHIQGHDVEIVASTEIYSGSKVNRVKQNLGYTKPSSTINEHGIPVKRIPYVKWLPFNIVRRLRIYNGFNEVLSQFEPEIIFIHGTQFISIRAVVKYARLHKNVRIYADCHADYINSGRNWISLNVLHKIIYRYCTQIIDPFVIRFYGTLPLRCKFIHDVYKISNDKIELLEMGADDTSFDLTKKDNVRKETRSKLSIRNDDFVIVTGGKITKLKDTHLLLEAIKNIDNDKIKLIVFGSIDKEMNELISDLITDRNIRYINWLSTSEIYHILLASDLGFFPGQHSALWEQFLGVGLPCVFRKWEGMEHLNHSNNCLFLEEASNAKIEEIIKDLFENKNKYNQLKENSEKFCVEHFSYSNISKRSIQL